MTGMLGQGFLVSLQIFAFTLVGSLPLGMLVAFARMSKFKPLALLARAYISIMRGTPLMLQMFAIYFMPYYVFGISLTTDSKWYATIVAFIINYAAYFAEIYRSGIQSIPRGQYEAASSLGMSYVQTMFSVILPQTVRRVIPTVTSDFITAFKDTSLLSSVGVMELMMFSKNLTTVSGNITPYVAAGIFYLIVTLPLIKVVGIVEERIARSERGAGPRPKAVKQLKEAADAE